MLSTEVENADVVQDKPAEDKGKQQPQVDRHYEAAMQAALKAASKAAAAAKEQKNLLLKARIRAYFRPNMNNFLCKEIPSKTKLRPLIKPFLDMCSNTLSVDQRALILSGNEMSREAVQLLMKTWMGYLREAQGPGPQTKDKIVHDPELDEFADMTEPHDWSCLYHA